MSDERQRLDEELSLDTYDAETEENAISETSVADTVSDEEYVDDVTEEYLDEASEENSDETSEENSDEASEENSDEASEENSDETSEENPDEASEESSDDASENNESADSNQESAPSGIKILPYHERYYLKYREGKRNDPMDLDGTKNFLQEIGYDGGELKQAREGKNIAEDLRNSDKNKSNQMYCSYCGTELSGVEFFRLPDGRMRCNTCSNTIVKSKAEVQELCKRVITNMDSFFGATIDVPVSIEVVDERKLKKKIGAAIGTKDSESILILGVAINKKKKYSIILENGAPRISLIATFAHELTHIWQYTHWDNNKNLKQCPKSKRLLIYEGMAKWAEIQYLYLIGETTVARREEAITRNRDDEYGVGFCLYENRYPLCREAMCCEETPFNPNEYPLN